MLIFKYCKTQYNFEYNGNKKFKGHFIGNVSLYKILTNQYQSII